MPKVKVAQKDGEIGIKADGPRKTWKITNHVAEVKQADLALFLRRSKGKLIESKPDSEKEQ